MAKIIPGGLMEKKIKEKKERFLKALRAHRGLVTFAAKSMDISCMFHYRELKNDPEYAAEVKLIQEANIDMSESQLLRSIKGGNIIANMFYLKCKAKHRGYIERQEVGFVSPDKQVKAPDSVVQKMLGELFAVERQRLADSDTI
jgi:hypothetical protein